MGLPESRAATIYVDELKKVLQICDVESLDKEQTTVVQVAYTLLVGATFIAPKQPNCSVPDELLECVLDPRNIGKYDWAGYILYQIKKAALRLEAYKLTGADLYVLGACPVAAELFYIEWVDFGEKGMDTKMGPKIGVYTNDKMKELIKLIMEDGANGVIMFKTKPRNAREGETLRMHPLIVNGGIVPASQNLNQDAICNLKARISREVLPLVRAAVSNVRAGSVEAEVLLAVDDARGKIVEKIVAALFNKEPALHTEQIQEHYGTTRAAGVRASGEAVVTEYVARDQIPVEPTYEATAEEPFIPSSDDESDSLAMEMDTIEAAAVSLANSRHDETVIRSSNETSARNASEVSGFAHNMMEQPFQTGMSFSAIQEAYDFYNLYSWEHGFGIKYGKCRVQADGIKTMQEIVCECSGKPRRSPKAAYRCDCPAMIRLLRKKDKEWYLAEQIFSHNHGTSVPVAENSIWPSHEYLEPYTKYLVSKKYQQARQTAGVRGTRFGHDPCSHDEEIAMQFQEELYRQGECNSENISTVIHGMQKNNALISAEILQSVALQPLPMLRNMISNTVLPSTVLAEPYRNVHWPDHLNVVPNIHTGMGVVAVPVRELARRVTTSPISEHVHIGVPVRFGQVHTAPTQYYVRRRGTKRAADRGENPNKKFLLSTSLNTSDSHSHGESPAMSGANEQLQQQANSVTTPPNLGIQYESPAGEENREGRHQNGAMHGDTQLVTGTAGVAPPSNGTSTRNATSTHHDVGGTSNGGVPSVTGSGFGIELGTTAQIKTELGENFPGKYGLSHETPNASAVLNFISNMMSCSERELDRKWFKHRKPNLVQLSGWDFKIIIGLEGKISFMFWCAVHRMVTVMEFKIYGLSSARWRHIFDPRFAHHLMNVNARFIDYEYMSSMMSPAALGYDLEYVKKLMIPVELLRSWSLYVVDPLKKQMYVMDPTMTEVDGGVEAMREKHEGNAKTILFGLIRCIHQNLPDWEISSSNWHVGYNWGTHRQCSSENSGVYILQYIREFNGTYLRPPTIDERLEYMRKEMAYQIVSLRGNTGDVPDHMLHIII